VHYYLGLLSKRHFKTQQAAAEFLEETKVSPRAPWAYEELGAIQLAQGHAERAAKSIEIARTYNPDNPELMSNLARAYIHLSRPEKALPLLVHAASLEPGDGSLHYQLARTYESLNRKQEAASEFSKAASLMNADSKAQVATMSSQFAVQRPSLVERDSVTLGH
jgi:predicted Zn-dependent protease